MTSTTPVTGFPSVGGSLEAYDPMKRPRILGTGGGSAS